MRAGELSGSHPAVPVQQPGSVSRSFLPHGATVHTPGIPSLGNPLAAGELVTEQILPHLVGMSLGGMEQRLVVPRTISPHSFALDLGDMEKIRHCEINFLPVFISFFSCALLVSPS